MTMAPDSRAAGRLRSVNAAEPVKKTNFARTKLPSSTGWMTAGSPAASVRVRRRLFVEERKIPAGEALLRGGT